MDEPTSTGDIESLLAVLKSYWGYDSFLPLQRESMLSAMQGRDSLVVLPTGGGKSLCYQAPALCREGLTVVVSPLISLMKDQVDALRSCGISADFSNSSQESHERQEVARRVRSGQTRLLYLSPERLVTDSTMSFLSQIPIAMIAVDEAHCISAWGHDFRPEYRRLGTLKQRFPSASIHAFTATATERVRGDIVEQLNLEDSVTFVGSFDRPNLFYRILPRRDRLRQISQVIARNGDSSGIVYCITRSDVETICKSLNDRGHRAAAYHAGLDDQVRKRVQESFINDQVNTIVATIAFGMGIDKPDVRYVIHAGMPKSLENYQQETGRAGRDGLEAECVLFYSGYDFHVWKSLIELSDKEPNAIDAVNAMYEFCGGVTCRHRALVQHFGQDLDRESCGACDVCNDEVQVEEEGQVLSQMIISCVARLGQRYGGDYTSLVLTGSNDARIHSHHHDQLSTYGLLKEQDRRTVRTWIEQLVDQDFLCKTGEYNVLEITSSGRDVLRGEATPRLLKPPPRGKKKKTASKSNAGDSWEGVDRGLFDTLRQFRKSLAEQQRVPAYIIFGDRSLREMARRRPSSCANLLEVSGVGAHKLEKYGEEFVAEINRYCDEHGLNQDIREDSIKN